MKTSAQIYPEYSPEPCTSYLPNPLHLTQMPISLHLCLRVWGIFKYSIIIFVSIAIFMLALNQLSVESDLNSALRLNEINVHPE